jgi:hypothetical protein
VIRPNTYNNLTFSVCFLSSNCSERNIGTDFKDQIIGRFTEGIAAITIENADAYSGEAAFHKLVNT